ncbi:MAG: OB-fold nucleic acid binding domain-containing protein [Gammaproteobacteria bacterium]|nr:OB-fold nucleic acid binding domain-containing protein [Gammaproteobacteria bacterium]
MHDQHEQRHCGRRLTAGPVAAASVAVFALPAIVTGQEDVPEQPHQYPDDTFITINGTVESVRPGAFVLDYGDGELTIEIDEAGSGSESQVLERRDRVSVYGIIDDGLFDRRTLEAGGVYVERLDETIYVSSVDEEDGRGRGVLELPRGTDPRAVVVTGRVTDVDENEETFTLATGSRSLDVKLDPTPLIPLDDEDPGTPTVEIGDVVSVTGRMDEDFFDGFEMLADRITRPTE